MGILIIQTGLRSKIQTFQCLIYALSSRTFLIRLFLAHHLSRITNIKYHT
nr:MAG TPA: hypothetical protein [Caudoviricetes sp.]